MNLILVRIERLPVGETWPTPSRWLGRDELARADAFGSPARRRQFVGSRWLLRELLAMHFGGAIEAWVLGGSEGSAPSLIRAPVYLPHALFLGLSHSGDRIACIVSDIPVGIDIEIARPGRSPAEERAALTLCGEEAELWKSVPKAGQEVALTRTWVCKESWFKARRGASWDFRRVRARASAAAHANVRAWQSGDAMLAVCCDAPEALNTMTPLGVDVQGVPSGSCWLVEEVEPPV